MSAPGTPKQEIGTYFTQWGIYGEAYYVKNLVTSGQASKLTYINYAFANIYQMPDGTFQCQSNTILAENGQGNGGDAYADYGFSASAANSVDGAADVWNEPLKGNFNQIKKLKTLYPNIKVLLSIGGWTWSKWFSAASATETLRQTLVSSCVDQYIKGNLLLDASDNVGGAGTGLGVFDGIDIDWEYPGVQGIGYNTVSPDDGANQVLLLQEFRTQLDAYGAQTGRKFYLTTAIGIAGAKIAQTQVANYSAFVDWINMMTYDFNGAWNPNGPTDFQSNLFIDPSSPNYATQPDFCIACAVSTMLTKGAPANKLHIGIPFYGRGWTGVTNVNNGLYQRATGAASGSVEAGINNYNVLLNAGKNYFNSVAQQSFAFDGSNWWSFDTPSVVQIKAQWAKQQGLGGLFAWSADGDDGSVLTQAMVAA